MLLRGVDSCLAKSPAAHCEMFSSDMFCPFSDSFLSNPPFSSSFLPPQPPPARHGLLQRWGCGIKGKYGMFTERIFKKC